MPITQPEFHIIRSDGSPADMVQRLRLDNVEELDFIGSYEVFNSTLTS
jgi:hypothetical protein